MFVPRIHVYNTCITKKAPLMIMRFVLFNMSLPSSRHTVRHYINNDPLGTPVGRTQETISVSKFENSLFKAGRNMIENVKCLNYPLP